MRAVTLCPACQTQFFVTDAQLKQHQGKVRCGECLHVFLATEHLVSIAAQETNIAASLTTESEAPADPLASHQAVHSDFASISLQAGLHDPALADAVSTTNLPTVRPNNTPTLGDYIPGGHRKSWFKSSRTTHAKMPIWLVWLIALMCGLLVIAAFAQTIYFYRSYIAAHYPNTKPYLQHVCKLLKCTIALPTNIQFIIIDDSDIQEDPDVVGVLRFTSTLQNQADYLQAYPNIELTLTDFNDKPLLRRIFKPVDYLPQHTDENIGFTAGESITINLAIMAKEAVVSGYRVSVHYE